MSNQNLAQIVADAWEMTSTLREYGSEPLTVGWWRGQPYVYIWNFQTGEMQWKPFVTTLPPARNPHRSPFENQWLYDQLQRSNRSNRW